MESNLLDQHGLTTFLAGEGYNFRSAAIGEKAVVKYIEKALQVANLTDGTLYSGVQVHGCQVAYADGSNGDDFVVGKVFDETDGLLTDTKEVILMVKFADCTPLILFDPVNGVQASVHSGWRGTAQRISVEALRLMQEKFESNLEDILVYVGPSIDQDNYEVGSEVYEAFKDFPQRDQFFKAGKQPDKYYLSMTDANLAILEEAGIQKKNIEVSRESTFSSPHLHSCRQEGKDFQLNAIFSKIRA